MGREGATDSLDQALQTPKEAVRLSDTLAGNSVSTLLRVGDRIDAEFIGVAGRAEMRNVAIGEVDANAVGVVQSGDLSEAGVGGEDGLEFFADLG